jgi:hypothetical protein
VLCGQAIDAKKEEKKEEKPVDPVVVAMTGRSFVVLLFCALLSYQ